MGRDDNKEKRAVETRTPSPETDIKLPKSEPLSLFEILHSRNEVRATTSNDEASDRATGASTPLSAGRSPERTSRLSRATSPWEFIDDASSPEMVYTPSNDEDSLDRTPQKEDSQSSENLRKLREEFDRKCIEERERSRKSLEDLKAKLAQASGAQGSTGTGPGSDDTTYQKGERSSRK